MRNFDDRGLFFLLVFVSLVDPNSKVVLATLDLFFYFLVLDAIFDLTGVARDVISLVNNGLS